MCQASFDELRDDEEVFYAVARATRTMFACPWGRKRQVRFNCQPRHLCSFLVRPALGCEPAFIGLARFPAVTPVTYRPMDDDRFFNVVKEHGCENYHFDRGKWMRWLERTGHDSGESEKDPKFQKELRIKTRLSGWRYSTFCKTQYASNPACGGLPNFLHCHISLVTLLDRIGKLPGMEVEIEDEADVTAQKVGQVAASWIAGVLGLAERREPPARQVGP